MSSSRIGLNPLLQDLSFGSVYFVESSTSNINEGHMRYTCRGRRLKMMPVNDECSRECLTIEVDHSILAEDVVSTLASLFRLRGAPAFIRLDRAGQSSSLEPSGGGWRPPGLEPSVRTLYIEPGSSWENAYSETFLSRFSDEMRKREMFADQLEAKVLVEDYRDHKNHHSPHRALG